MKTQKGISTPFAILVIGIVVIIGFAIFYSYQYIWVPEEEITISEKMPEKKGEEETYIKVISPNGGENWRVGETYNVKWESGGLEGKELYVCLTAVNDDKKYGVSAKKEWANCPYGEYLIAKDVPITQGVYGWKISEGIEERFKITPGFYRIDLIYLPEEPMVPGQVWGAMSDYSDGYFSIVGEDETADWKTYRNENFGYEIKYPVSWKAPYPYWEPSWSAGISLDNDNYCIVDVWVISGSMETERSSLLGEGYIQTSMKVGGVNGIKLTRPQAGAGLTEAIYFTYGDFEFRIGRNRGVGDEIEDECINVFNQMLSTFKFIE